MGYYMYFNDSKFFISEQHFPKLLITLCNFIEKYNYNEPNMSNVIALQHKINICFDSLYWYVDFDSFGNITYIEFSGEKLLDDNELFEEIAEYIENKSYIEMRGEDGELWRWLFCNGICKTTHPNIVWEECKEIFI